jgi:hypothetical protein
MISCYVILEICGPWKALTKVAKMNVIFLYNIPIRGDMIS